MELLLISNSTAPGGRYLDHCAPAISALLGSSVKRLLFIPYAVFDRAGYAATTRARFEELGFALDSVHDAPSSPVRAVERAEAIFIGGGNTFRLIDALWRTGLIEPIRQRVQGGMPYIGSSAGSNVACPTIKTTNDMPVVEPPSFNALSLVPFNINSHYQDPVPGSTHMGETREQRIAEFHEENDPPVVGLREGSWLVVNGIQITLEGSSGARVFRRGSPPTEWPIGSRLDFLIARHRVSG
ncbi:MAG TPA: dipeptidase PepE [Vicinamibacterales bacterium]|nr:dipeptidase PepE [Vicinamibacterales bacterium]